MSAWSKRYGTGSSPVAGAGAGRTYGSTSLIGGSGSLSGGVYKPTAPGGVTGDESDSRPGSFNVNLLDPVGTAEGMKDPISSLFDGIRQFTVGANEGREGPDFVDNSALGKVPVVGNIGRGIANVIGGGGEVVGKALDATGGLLERIPSPLDPTAGPDRIVEGKDGSTTTLRLAYEALPLDFRQKFEEENAFDKGLANTGFLSNEGHLFSKAIRAFAEEEAWKHPSLDPGAFTPPGSFADQITNWFDIMNASADYTASVAAQFDAQGEGSSYLDQIKAVGNSKYKGDGTLRFAKDEGLLNTGAFAVDNEVVMNPLEELVYAKVSTGEWTDQEAADFLASNMQGWGHTTIGNLGGMVLGDPLNIAAVGGGVIAKMGSTGAKIARIAALSEKTLKTTEAALKAAQAGEKLYSSSGKLIRGAARANRVRTLEAEYKAAQEAAEAFTHWSSSGQRIRKVNLIARAAEGSTKTQSLFRQIGVAYNTLDGTRAGQIAKLSRTLIDPLHALDLGNPAAKLGVDLYSDAVPRTVLRTIGIHHYKGMLDEALKLDPSGELTRQLQKDLAVASSNLGREGVVDVFRATQVDGGLAGKVAKTTLGEDMFEHAANSVRQGDLEAWLRQMTTAKVIKETWTASEKAQLAEGLARRYPQMGRSADEWLEWMKTANKEQMSLFHFANYGGRNRDLLNFVHAMPVEVAEKLPDKINKGRLILIAKGTLTKVGAESALTRLTRMRSTKNKLLYISELQEKYPKLRYITIDPANLERSVDNFVAYLEDIKDSLPMQLLDDEAKKLGDEAAGQLKDISGPGYDIGFAPEERFRWGLERENGTGLYRPAGEAFPDHVADGAMPYRPMNSLRTNILGHPLVNVPGVRVPARMVDHLHSAAVIMKQQVSGAQIAEMARKQFIHRAVTGDIAEHGVTEQVASDWWERLMEYTRTKQGYSGPRGFSGDELYRAIREKNLIPQALLNGSRQLNPDDIMRLVLEAYDGDMRFIGLTQKLSARAKRAMFEMTGSNFAGQIAEHAWPTLKFRYYPIFQLQEKIEPWVLTGQRGANVALTTNMTEADRATEKLLQRMTNNSLVRMGDIDQWEYSAEALFQGLARKTSARPGTALHKMQQFGKAVTDVQGVKRLNMLRTFQKGLGRDIRAMWDAVRPGEFDQMLEHAQAKVGRRMGDDEFALQLVSENMFANDIIVNRTAKALRAGGMKADDVGDFANAIKTAQWHIPTTLGELRRLDLEHLAEKLRLVDASGEEITDLKKLREALANDPKRTMDNIKDGLTRLGAHEDYIRRVENALDFSWGGFWKTAEKRFGLSADDSMALQDMMEAAADMRGMTPVEFMSQVFSPTIVDGVEGVLGHIDGTRGILSEYRAAGRKITRKEAKYTESRTKLAGKAGVSKREDLIRQLAATFGAHLDPSAKRALLMEFKPELRAALKNGTLKMDTGAELEAMWKLNGEGAMADRLLGFVEGKRPTGAAVEFTEDTGVKVVRDAADRYMLENGVTPLDGRPHFEMDADATALHERAAGEYAILPERQYDRSGRIPNAGSLKKSSTELRVRRGADPAVDDRTHDAFQAMVIDVDRQYAFLTREGKGGMGVKVTVTRTTPYASLDEMRADIAKGRLKVFGGESDHPLMTNDQVVKLRAVREVFGHGSEAYEAGARGELNASARHARMFSNEGRAAYITEVHGSAAYEGFSKNIVTPGSHGVPAQRQALDPANPIASFEAIHGEWLPDPAAQHWIEGGLPEEEVRDLSGNKVIFRGKDAYGHTYSMPYTYRSRIGENIKALPPDQQMLVLQPLSDLLQEFPELKVHHFDMVSFKEPLLTDDKGILTGLGFEDAGGLTWGSESAPVIILNSDALYHARGFTPDTNIEAHQYWAGTRQRTQVWDHFGKKWIEKRSSISAPEMARPYTIGYIVRHETGHAFDSMRRPAVYDAAGNQVGIVPVPGQEAYQEMMGRFERLGSSMDLSEYGMSNPHEFGAELFAFATDPRYDADKIAEPALRDMAEEYRQYLIDSGEWQPLRAAQQAAPPVEPPMPSYVPGGGDLTALAKQKLRTTTNINGAHFMAPDGTLLRGAGEHWEAANAVGGESKMRGAGFIRISGSSDTHLNLDISGPLTSDQYAALKDAIRTRKSVTIDLHEGRYFDDGTEYVSNLDGMRHETWSNERVLNDARARLQRIATEKNGGPDFVPSPGGVPPVPPEAPKTVAEHNAAKPGSAKAPKKVGLLPQDYLDEFTQRYVGQGKHIESNPDVARVAQQFAKWTNNVITNGLLKNVEGAKVGVHGQLLQDIAGIPTGQASPFNYTESMVVALAEQAMATKWQDAFRLQYFSQSRSMLERSLNHPMFGLYPASYMWGKIAPEMIRFIATQPFGVKTGALGYTLMDTQRAVALRREYDPYFDAQIESLGHSQALSFGGYLLPALPWDIGAGVSPIARSVAEQGLRVKREADAGKQKDLSLVDPAVKTFERLAPLTTGVPWAGRAIDEVSPFRTVTEEEQARKDLAFDKAVQAADLSPFMERAYQELRDALK